MGKMTKMQLNRTEVSLNAVKNKKIRKFKEALPAPSALYEGKTELELSIEEAKENPKVFLDVSLKRLNSSNCSYVRYALNDMPRVKKIQKKVEALAEKNSKKTDQYTEKLTDEIDRIMTELYLADSADALAMIEAFKAL